MEREDAPDQSDHIEAYMVRDDVIGLDMFVLCCDWLLLAGLYVEHISV